MDKKYKVVALFGKCAAGKDTIQNWLIQQDSNIKKITQDKTIGIVICRKNNKYIIEYCSDDRIFRTIYSLT